MNDVSIDKQAFLALRKLDELPACDAGMELARSFLLRACEAVDRLDQDAVIATRNALIRAHKELVAHRSECLNSMKSMKPPINWREKIYGRTRNSNHHENRSRL